MADPRGGDPTLPNLFARAWWLFFNSIVTFLSGLLAQVNLLQATVNGTAGGAGTVPYDLVCSFVGKPSSGQLVMIFTAPRAVSYPANFAGSVGTLTTNPTSTAVYTIANNGTTIGTLSISTGGVFTFATTSGTSKSLAVGDRLTITAPSPQDASLINVGFTMAGTR